MTKIFISIAAYRDPELVPTIQDAIDRAKNPDDLSFGVIWQYKEGDETMIAPMRNHPQVSIEDVPAGGAKGVCWARHLARSLWKDEPYTLQIDSHTRFVDGWDELIIEQLNQCPSPKALLTAYVPPYDPPDHLSDNPPCSLGINPYENSCISEDGLPRFLYKKPLNEFDRPQPGAFISGHFLFGASKFWQEVPYDPWLYFTGEESTLAVRAYTSGWDVFYPNKTIVYHYYSREGRVKHWDDNSDWWQYDVTSKKKARSILCGESVDEFGLGTVRTIEEYYNFSGVNYRTGVFEQKAVNGEV